MITGVVNGSDVLFLVSNGDEYIPFVCAKDMSIETTTQLIPVTTVGDGFWDKFSGQSLGYSITLTGVIKFAITDEFSAFDMIDQQLGFVPIEYKMIFESAQTGQVQTIKGSCFIERSALSGNSGSLALSDFTLKGSGRYQSIGCDIKIGTIAITGTGDTRTVTLSDILGGTPVSYIYQLDNNLEQTTTSNPFTLSNIDVGSHTLIVIPVCISGKRGEDFSKDFMVESVLVPACPVVTGVIASDITDSGFSVSFTPSLNAVSYRVEVRNVSTSNVTVFISFVSPVAVNNLLAATQYEVTVISVCASVESSNSTHIVVQTTGTGAHPNVRNLHVFDLASGTFSVGWINPSGATSYRVRVTNLSNGTYQEITVSSTPAYFTNLTANTQYNVRVTAIYPDGEATGATINIQTPP